jgi:hypothetical protein
MKVLLGILVAAAAVGIGFWLYSYTPTITVHGSESDVQAALADFDSDFDFGCPPSPFCDRQKSSGRSEIAESLRRGREKKQDYWADPLAIFLMIAGVGTGMVIVGRGWRK